MIRTVLVMVVSPGNEQVFEKTWREAAARIANRPGCVGQSLAQDQASQRTFSVVSDWERPEDLAAFQVSPERVALSTALDPLRESATKSVWSVLCQV